MKLKSQANSAERDEAGSRLEQLSARWGVLQKEPLLFKNFLPVWERRMKASGPTTQPRTGWYWYLDEKDWMPKSSKDSEESVQPAREVQAQREAAAALEQYHFQNVLLLNLPKEADVPAVAKAFAADPAVEYAHPDYVMKAQFVPNDPYYASSGAWGQSFRDLWGLEKIEAEKAWDITQGQGVVVAVSDTGIDYNHPDIAANVWTNPGEIPGNGIDDDGNGFVDDVRGWNFVAGNNDPMDDHGHGTHVAGTIAAVGNNGLGIIGVAPQAKVMAVKGLDKNGSGTLSALASGILYAADNGAKVINASWGGFGETPALLQEVISFAHDVRDVVFVAAAGNDTTDVGNPEEGFFPANIREVVTVSAFDHLDQKASFSNFGAKIDMAAPGGGDADPAGIYESRRSILSLKSSLAGDSMTGSGQLIIGADYLRQAGTSMAAPHVSGAAALVRALHPEFSAEQVRQALRSGSDDTGAPGFDPLSGYGRLNVKGALAQNDPLEVWLTPLAKKSSQLKTPSQSPVLPAAPPLIFGLCSSAPAQLPTVGPSSPKGQPPS